MAFLEAFRMAWDALRSHKLRSSLTLLGMVIGVFAIIVSVTGVEVIDVYFKDRLQFLGASTFTIRRTPSIQLGELDPSIRNRPAITYDQVERLARAMTTPVTISIIEDFALAAVRYENRETEPNVVLLGTDEHMPGNFSYEIEQGRFLSEQDLQYARPVIVLGSAVAEELFPIESPLGKTVRMDGHRYEVIGVLKEKGSFLGFNQDTRVFAPITRLMSLYGQPDRNIATISVRAHEPQHLRAAMDEVIGRFRVIRKVPPGRDNNFEIETNDSMQSIFEAFTGTLTLGGAVIGLIALLAAGIGIMNIMLVSVTERTREIGIRKAVGARRRDIMRQFLLEAFFLCQIGGVFGIVLGALVGNLVAVYFEISPAFPTGWAVGAVVMVTGIALLFGGYPAFKAAGLNPIESLRYE
ncbi:ABC transporter permease [Rhodocaloribacter litoris]|uniref:ABC transporter permease n=1 Tax=Rhodocaloribacter litoris TaxID=2558931 RepID=UPI001422E6B6|nr:ABC transporter permease [Rhodocaloribacter litoris]QXD14159.1 ABC transporter permease [Rhodocaloribacter litoris]GIV59970.1 MAG: ABC transporter permease [Rhodothermaceae bacterium]